jgi:hypothetical protein
MNQVENIISTVANDSEKLRIAHFVVINRVFAEEDEGGKIRVTLVYLDPEHLKRRIESVLALK